MRRRFIIMKLKFFPVIILFFTILLIAVNIFGRNSNGIAGKVIARVVYTFPEALPGEKIELIRILTKEGAIVLVSSSPIYKTINDINELKGRERALIKQKYGNLSEGFIGKFNSKNDNDSIKVVIRFKYEITRDYLRSLNLSEMCEFIDNKTVLDSISKAVIKTLIFNPSIYEIDEYRKPVFLSGGDENCRYCNPNPQAFYTGDAYSRSFFNFPAGVDSMPSWARGSGVNIATFELGINDTTLKVISTMHPNLETGYIYRDPGNVPIWIHSAMCFHAMLHTAPNAKLFHFQALGETGININDIKNNNISVASISVLNCYSNEFDALTYESHSAIIIAGTGNYSVSLPNNVNDIYEYKLWYNTISAGGCVYSNNQYYEIVNDEYFELWPDGHWRMASTQTQTQCRNSSPINTYIDKETPHIVCPTRTTCTGGAGPSDTFPGFIGTIHGFSGTSAGAPSMVGICASVISANPNMMKPNTIVNVENVKTALMVTAENIDAGYWNPLVDGRDGCGVVSGYHAALFAKNIGNTSKTPASLADTIGLAFGQINESTPDSTVIRFNVRTPVDFPVGKHFRAVLTWSSSTNADSVQVRTCSDLNLELRDKTSGKRIDQCYSFEDNIEVVDVEHRELEKNHEYFLDIIVSKLNFPSNPTRNYIKYSLGWTWVKDFSGKKIENISLTADTSFELLNRNIQCNNAVFTNTSKTLITADDRIELNPGTVIEDGAQFTAQIVKQAARYDLGFFNYTNISTEIDLSGNYQTAAKSDSGQVLEILNKYCQLGSAAARFADGKVNYRLNKDTLVSNPEYIGGLNLRMWIKFCSDTVSTGYLFTCMKDGEGYYLKVDDFGQYFKRLTFFISGGGSSSTISYNVGQNDIETWSAFLPKTYNRGWVHVSALWRAGDSVALYVNGNPFTYVTAPTNVKYIPPNQCYIGADPSISFQSFKGGIDEVRLYSGPESYEHNLAEYYKYDFPTFQGSWYPLSLQVGNNGQVAYDINYTDIENPPPDTVPENSIYSFKICESFSCSFKFMPNAGKLLNYFRIIYRDRYGNIIDTLNNSSDLNWTETFCDRYAYEFSAFFGDSIFTDNFESGCNWIFNPYGTDNATSGTWQHGGSVHTKFQLWAKDLGKDLVTGEIAGVSDSSNDLDGGESSVMSPDITLPSSGQITLNFSYYFNHDSLATNEDYLQVLIVGSTTSTILDVRGTSTLKIEGWKTVSSDISGFAGQTVKILIKAADNANENIVEAGIDGIKIINY